MTVLRAVLLVWGLFFLWGELFLRAINLRRNHIGILATTLFLVVCALLLKLPTIVRTIRGRHERSDADERISSTLNMRRDRFPLHRRVWLASPVAIAVLVLLFEPEAVGLCQHILHPGRLRISNYEITRPLTSIILRTSGDASDVLTVMKARGMARMPHEPYWFWLYEDSEFSLWQSSTPDFSRPPSPHPFETHLHEDTSTLTQTIAKQDATCWLFTYRYSHSDLPSRSLGPVAICTTRDGLFHARFDGRALELPAFFDFLQRRVKRVE